MSGPRAPIASVLAARRDRAAARHDRDGPARARGGDPLPAAHRPGYTSPSATSNGGLSEHVLDSYSSSANVRMVQLDERGPHVLWREPTLSSRHWASRIDVFGEIEEVLFDIQRTTLGFLRFGDIDGDGRTDAIDHNFGGGAQWFRGDPELGLALDPEPMVLPVGYGLTIIADFDGDGLVDVAVGNNYYTDLITAFGDGTGVFTEADSFNFDPRGGYQPADFHSLQGGWEWFMVQHLLCDSCSGSGIALGSIGADGSIGEHQRIEGIIVNRLLGSDDHDGDGVLDLLVTVFDPEPRPTSLEWHRSRSPGARARRGPGGHVPVA